MTTLLRIENLCASYGGQFKLHSISENLPVGSFTGILGPNGCGKSTLLKCIRGSLAPFSGRILLAGEDVSTMPPKMLARKIAFAGQTEAPADMPCLQYALLGRFPWLPWLGFFSQKDYEIANASLELAGIAHKAKAKTHTLSAGQWQLAALSRSLAQIWDVEHPLLLLDEPAANLDLNRRMEIFILLLDLARRGWTIVAAMHDCNLAALFCDSLIGIKNGAPVFSGPTIATFNLENLNALYDWPLGNFTHPDVDIGQVYPRLNSDLLAGARSGNM